MVTRAAWMVAIAALSAVAVAVADEKLPVSDEEAEPRVSHVPIAWAAADEPLEMSVEVKQAHLLARITLHYRRSGETAFHDLAFARAAEGYAVTVPAADLAPGAMEYYIGSHTVAAPSAPERLHFASPTAPHPFLVVGDEETRWRKELLAAELGNRSRFRLRGELAHFGVRTLADGSSINDYYWRTEGDFTYRFLGFIYSIRLGAGVLRGETYLIDYNKDKNRVDKVGLTYGFAEVRFRVHRLVRFDLSATLGAGPQNFDGGGGAQLIIGNDPGTSFAIGGDRITTVGGRGWLRLSWNTVPKLPMSLTLEATDLPSMNALSGRVYFTATLRPSRHFSLDALVGYATRDNGVGGPTAGLAAAFEF